MISCAADKAEIENRYKAANEIADELPEEEKNNLNDKRAAAEEDAEKYRTRWADVMSRVKQIKLDTGCSKEALVAEIRS